MICLTGLPLAGKTTLALRLAKKYDFTYVSTGDVVRGLGKLDKDFSDLEHMKKTGYSLKRNEYIMELVKHAPYRSIIDGYPRNLEQVVIIPNIPIVVLLVEHVSILAARAKVRGRDEMDGYWLERVKSFDKFLTKLQRLRPISILITTSQEKCYDYLEILAKEHRQNGGVLFKLRA